MCCDSSLLPLTEEYPSHEQTWRTATCLQTSSVLLMASPSLLPMPMNDDDSLSDCEHLKLLMHIENYYCPSTHDQMGIAYYGYSKFSFVA